MHFKGIILFSLNVQKQKDTGAGTAADEFLSGKDSICQFLVCLSRE